MTSIAFLSAASARSRRPARSEQHRHAASARRPHGRAVQAMLGDVGSHRRPDQLLDRLARGRALAHLEEETSSSGDLEKRRRAASAAQPPPTRAAPSASCARPATASEASRAVAAGSRHAGSVPRDVRSHDERQLGIRMAGMDRSQGIHGIGRPAALDLQRRTRRRHSPPATAQPAHLAGDARGPGSCSVGLCGGVRAGISSDALQAELAARMAREREVPEVRRVERPAEDAERAQSPRPAAFRRGRVRRPRRGT